MIFDALKAARARNIDVLIADTAGRLHTQTHLMEELKKVKRVLARLDPTAPHEVLLVLDGTIGQNAVAQAEEFNKGLGVTGLVITKLDGTAKGGVVLAIAQRLKIPDPLHRRRRAGRGFRRFQCLGVRVGAAESGDRADRGRHDSLRSGLQALPQRPRGAVRRVLRHRRAAHWHF